MSNAELLDATVRAARNERQATAELLALLAEVDERRLYLGEGCSSLFSYCTRVLQLSEHAAYHRIEAARAARQFPIVLTLVASGEVTLTTVAMLRPHFTPDNHVALLSGARHKTKREVEYQIACLTPKAAAAAIVRRLPRAASLGPSAISPDAATPPFAPDPAPSPTAPMTSPAAVNAPMFAVPAGTADVSTGPRTRVAPLSSEHYLLRVTLDAGAHANLRRAQDLMRHSVPDGDVSEIVGQALALLVEQLEKRRVARVARPRSSSAPARTDTRHIPAEVKREVWMRDGGRCAFVGARGRCAETSWLEFHHVRAFAHGGAADAANISLRCRAHNQYESEQLFGPWRDVTAPST